MVMSLLSLLNAITIGSGWMIYIWAIIMTVKGASVYVDDVVMRAPKCVFKCVVFVAIFSLGATKYPILFVGACISLASAIWAMTYKLRVNLERVSVSDYRGQFQAPWADVQRIEIEMIDGEINDESARSLFVLKNGECRDTSAFDLCQITPLNEHFRRRFVSDDLATRYELPPFGRAREIGGGWCLLHCFLGARSWQGRPTPSSSSVTRSGS